MNQEYESQSLVLNPKIPNLKKCWGSGRQIQGERKKNKNAKL